MGITKKFKFRNGDEVVEKITGFRGVITGTCFYITGCNQYLITAKAKNEHTGAKALWYDEGRLEYQGTKVEESDVKGEDNGCDIPAPGGQRGM